MGINVNAIRALVKTSSKFFEKSNVKETAKKVNDELFCHKLWRETQDARVLRTSQNTVVQNHGYLNGINHVFVSTPEGIDLTKKISIWNNQSIKDIIYQSDIDFKKLPQTTETINVFRAIGKKLDFQSTYKTYKKTLDTKVGDIINMREYAYAATDRNYASNYLSNNEGIMYEIEVPKGARVSLSSKIQPGGKLEKGCECVFPRSSQFICTGKMTSPDGLTTIKLRYMLPNEPWRK